MHTNNRESILKTIKKYQQKGAIKRSRLKKNQDENVYLDLTNVWQAKTISQQQQYQAIRKSGIFNQKRKSTFVRFNYRSTQSNELNYENAFKKILKGSKSKRGTMNVVDLWSQKRLKEIMGSLPFPNDRSKVLKIYLNGRDKKYQRLTTY